MTAELTGFEVKELPSFRLIGKKLCCDSEQGEVQSIPEFWGECFDEGVLLSLEGHPRRLYEEVVIGWIGDYDPDRGPLSYIVGILAETGAEVPEDMVGVDIPASRYAVGTIRGTEPDIFSRAHPLTKAEIEMTALSWNRKLGFEMEWYDQRFCADDTNRVIDLYIPVINSRG